jgi:hypothetical protein
MASTSPQHPKRQRFSYPSAGQFAPPEIKAWIAKWKKLPEVVRGTTPLLYALLGDGTPLFKLDKSDAAYTDDTTGLAVGAGEDVMKHPRKPDIVVPGTRPDVVLGTGYQHGQTCSNCQSAYQHLTTGTFLCDRVRGVIAPAGWCNRWNPPWPKDLYAKYQEGGREVLPDKGRRG